MPNLLKTLVSSFSVSSTPLRFAVFGIVFADGVDGAVQIVGNGQQIFGKRRNGIFVVFFNFLSAAFFGVFGISVSAQKFFFQLAVFGLEFFDFVISCSGLCFLFLSGDFFFCLGNIFVQIFFIGGGFFFELFHYFSSLNFFRKHVYIEEI